VSKELAVLATVIAGGAAAAQAPINNMLSKQVGDFGAASVSFAVGLAFAVILTFVFAGGIDTTGGESVAWYYWLLGGVGGVIIVTTSLIAVRELGAGGVTAAIIAGQLTLSLILDKLGVIGLTERPIRIQHVIGVGLLAAGVFLIVKE
jgi:bacterial/archaeal transporter family-2 protein